MISQSDRLIVIFQGLKVSRKAFRETYPGAENSLGNWLNGTEPRPDAIANIVDTLKKVAPEKHQELVEHLVRKVDLGAQELLEACGVAASELSDKVSAAFRQSLLHSGMRPGSMTQFTSFALPKRTAIDSLFKKLVGRWTLYRHHSSEFGILRETVILHEVRAAFAAGTYYQYDPASAADGGMEPRKIETNLFFCGDIVMSFGSLIYDEGRKIEPIITSLLNRPFNAVPEPFARHVHLAGLLLALADGTGVPAAMRIVARHDADLPELPENHLPAGLVTSQDEIDLYGDAVKNDFQDGEYALLHSKGRLAMALNRGIAKLERRRVNQSATEETRS